jgi:hypothetical protein
MLQEATRLLPAQFVLGPGHSAKEVAQGAQQANHNCRCWHILLTLQVVVYVHNHENERVILRADEAVVEGAQLPRFEHTNA